MNKLIKFLICFTFFEIILSAENNFSNYIENDHRIRNFSFMGPFPKDFDGDSLLAIYLKVDSEINEINHKGVIHTWSNSSKATGSDAFHNLWHVFPNSKPGDIILAKAYVTLALTKT